MEITELRSHGSAKMLVSGPEGEQGLFSAEAVTSLVPQVDVNSGSVAFAFFRESFGFIPNHILALAPLPRLIDAEFQISSAFLFRERALTRRQKELILLAVSVAYENSYTVALHYQMLHTLRLERDQLDKIVLDYRQAGLPESEMALLDLALRLGRHPTCVTRGDIEGLRTHGFADEHILETVLTTSWAGYLCSLSAGLSANPNFEPPDIPLAAVRRTAFLRPTPRAPGEPVGPHIRVVDLAPESFKPFASIRKRWGFVPNLFQAQTLWPDLVEAELRAINLWLNTGDVLTQCQKECIFLAISAKNLNTYCVAAHCEILRGLGISEEQADQIALDHHRADLSEADKILVDVSLKLARQPATFSGVDLAALGKHGFSEEQILEAIVIVAITSLINTLNTGLGVVPDFETRVHLGLASPHFSSAAADLLDRVTPRAPLAPQEDPDAEAVAKVQAGDTAAFEELIRRHGRRVQRTLAGILGQVDDVEDAVQDTFLKAFQHVGGFQGHSRFSTWLTRIAVNVGLQILRRKREILSLDERPIDDEPFYPREVRAWQDDPEQTCSKAEMRDLVFSALAQLPLHYRVVVMLRDLHQLSAEETAATLGVEVPGVKSRLFRGRLMLRDILSRQLTKKDGKDTYV